MDDKALLVLAEFKADRDSYERCGRNRKEFCHNFADRVNIPETRTDLEAMIRHVHDRGTIDCMKQFQEFVIERGGFDAIMAGITARTSATANEVVPQ